VADKTDMFVCNSIIPDHKNEKITKIGALPTKLSQNSLALAFMECQSFQMYIT